MPGRQAHGRSLLANAKVKSSGKKSKARSQKNALDAFGIAQEKFPTRQKRTPRVRELDAESERKHAREEDEDGDEEGDGEPSRKKTKVPSRPVAGDDAEYGSDSEGNEWRLGGLAEDDEDSEIESDDAFGDSDDDKFQGYSFRGTQSKKTEAGDPDDDSNDDEGETLGADAIDLATALDQFEEDSDVEEPEGDEESGSDDSSEEESDGSDDSDDDQEEEDDEADPAQLKALQGLISDYGGEQVDDAEDTRSSKQKIGLGDLGLSSLNDPFMKKSVRLMNKEQKEKRPGAAKKLNVPLPRRQQDRLDRSAAYEKTNETLDRWTETVKQNRRAEHLVFPLPQNSATAGLDTTEIQPLTAKSAGNELESTIMSIMDQSGLSLQKKAKPKPQEFDEEGNLLSRKEALDRKRMERELNARETKRAKRIKKIKSKAYHRVHRKQRERDEVAAKEAMQEAGEIDSEEEREAQDRRRALERVGQRHKESKWAKIGARTKRAVWDDDFRAGLTEMARKDEELRRRKEGRKGGVDESDSDATSSSGEDDSDDDLRRRLDALEGGEDEGPRSKLMSLKFMQKAEAAKRKANDDLIKQIRRDLDGEEEETGSGDEEVGRRRFGVATAGSSEPAPDTSRRASRRGRARDDDDGDGSADDHATANISSAHVDAAAPTPADTAASTAGAWSRGQPRRASKKSPAGARAEELDLDANVLVAARPAAASKPSKAKRPDANDEDDDSASDTEQLHLPLAIRDQELVARAFAGEDVVGDFEREKADVAEADDDKVVDQTLPGWGSWVGEGVGARERSRHQGRFVTKIQGVKKKDRKDAKLDKVIINEKRIKKNDLYLASQLPHPFESRQQYERSLRLPVGPEWMTKQTFQDTTKPRVLLKQGIIAPISKPTA
ncbi:utp14 protein [Hirsutella rhossiliensis]|uniref:Utp14 protein n=1 Tax=Hirsutella rhossiliensis TaxID=111463 RepID=A0A9P8MPL8_9HYPO|nr:utp14 protein [Hirsutella rhossiliensis]KAH0958762.1 utp14 protein [Hirsutella rhossiliensis]